MAEDLFSDDPSHPIPYLGRIAATAASPIIRVVATPAYDPQASVNCVNIVKGSSSLHRRVNRWSFLIRT